MATLAEAVEVAATAPEAGEAAEVEAGSVSRIVVFFPYCLGSSGSEPRHLFQLAKLRMAGSRGKES